MINFITTKLAVIYAMYVTRMHCLIVDNTQKPHVDYDVLGVAKVSAIQKVELTRDNEEVMLVTGLTNEITKRFDSGYYKSRGLIISTEGEVLLETLRQVQTLPNGVVVVKNRQEYLDSVMPTSKARITYPDGTTVYGDSIVRDVIAGIRTTDSVLKQHLETGRDESFALSA